MRGRGATLAAAVVMAGLCAYYARFELIDDAYISFRYAENWLAGAGLVFNPGERVEGFTNFLWVVLMAAGSALGIDPEWSSRVLGAGFALLTVAVVADFAPRVGNAWGLRRGTAPLLFAVSLAPALWAVHGLETPLFTALLALAFRSDLRGIDEGRASSASAVWFALASLTRPEGVALFLARLGVGVLLGRGAFLRRDLVRLLFIYLAIVGPFFLARLAYYGEPLPNTFYAKAGLGAPPLERGLAYLGSFFLAWGSLLFATLAPAARAALRQPRIAYAGCLLGAGLAVVALEGGDAFPGFRFLVPLLPLLYFLVQEGCVAARERLPARAAPALGAAVVVAAALHVFHIAGFVNAEVRGGDEFTARMKLVGRALGERVPAGTWIALNPVGALPYASGLPAIDMLGITDPHIARLEAGGSGIAGHDKGDGRYVLERRPEIILLGNVLVVPRLPKDLGKIRWPLYGRSEHELARLPGLPEDYAVDSLPLEDGRHAVFLRRRDFRLSER